MPDTSSPPSLPAAGSVNPTDSKAALKVAVAWLYVGIPLAWGVWEVAVKSLDLFIK